MKSKCQSCFATQAKETIHLKYRLLCANLHFNKNSQRQQAKTKKGDDRQVVIYSKANNGEKAIARKIKEEPTYSNMFKLDLQNKSNKLFLLALYNCLPFVLYFSQVMHKLYNKKFWN